MAAVVANLASGISGTDAPLLLGGTGRDQRHLIVVAVSDRGLAGGFNSSVVRMARERIASLLQQGKDVKIITIGRKARDQLRRAYANRFGRELMKRGWPEAAQDRDRRAARRAERIIDMYMTGETDVVTLISSRFKSVVTQTPTALQLIPATVPAGAGNVRSTNTSPTRSRSSNSFWPQNITIQVLTALLENDAGFYAAQMTAMDNATRNAGDHLINALTIRWSR